jgi:hypothetical protein
MEIHWTPPAFLPYLIVFLLGYVVGLFEGRWRHGSLVKKLEAERDAAREEAAEARAALEQAGTPAPGAAIPERGLWLDGTISQLDGTPLTRETLTPERRKRLLALLETIAHLLKGTPPPAKSQPAPPTAAPQPAAAVTPKNAPAAPPPSKPAPARPLASGRALSIVEQIDEILQTLLEGTPLDSLGVRLQEATDGSVEVWIGLKRYSGVDEVPDAEVQRVIRLAIKTWEQRHS